jgi:TonB family protein
VRGRNLNLKLRMPAFAITTALILLWSGWFQVPAMSEKRAVASAQKILASELDAELPAHPFADWFRQVVGPQAGVNWQLNECGEQRGQLLTQRRDLLACAEVDALLPDGRKVVVMIEVGTFDKGITGVPSFSHAAIEQQGDLYRVRRLRDLPEGLRAPASLARGKSIRLAPLAAPMHLLLPETPIGKALTDVIAGEAAPPPPPRPAAAPPAPSTPVPTPPAPFKPAPTPPAQSEMRKVSEGVVRGNAIVKAAAIYPASAKKMQAAGSVQVQVMISEEGRVIEATTISGHPLLRGTAVDAARKWVFKPTMLNGIPVKVQSTLTFVFTLTQ